jgi:hypothetical protein
MLINTRIQQKEQEQNTIICTHSTKAWTTKWITAWCYVASNCQLWKGYSCKRNTKLHFTPQESEGKVSDDRVQGSTRGAWGELTSDRAEEKWLQFLCIRWYALPLYSFPSSSTIFSMSSSRKSVLPKTTASLKEKKKRRTQLCELWVFVIAYLSTYLSLETLWLA